MKINGNPDGGGGSAVIEGLSITSNGTYTAGAGVDGYSPVEVNVPSPEFITETLNVSVNNTYYPGAGVDGFSQVVVDVQPELQDKTVIENGEYIADQGYYGLGTVTVSVPSPQFVTESLSVSVNGTYTPGQGVDGYSQVVVNVPQSVTGFTEKEITEGVQIANLNNNANYVGQYTFIANNIQTVNLPDASYVGSSAFYQCHSLTTVNLPNCLKLNGYTFAETNSLSFISLPVCISVSGGEFALCGCSEIELPMVLSTSSNIFRGNSLTSVSLPMCIDLKGGTFQYCSNLRSLTLGLYNYKIVGFNYPFNNTTAFTTSGTIYVNSEHYNSYITTNGWSSLSSIFVSVSLPDPILSYSNGSVFGCTYFLDSYYLNYLNISRSNVTYIDLPSVKYISASTFMSHKNLSIVSLPDCRMIQSSVFVDCDIISEINLPQCLQCEQNAFQDCDSLISVNLPVCRSIGYGAFTWCSSLSSLNLPKCQYLGSSVFNRCGNLSVVTLGNSEVCILGGSSLGISFTGSIYVPASLVDAYKSAQYWSGYSNKIFPIE